MAPALAGTIKSEVDSLSKNVCEMIFKLAVEVGLSSSITAALNDVSDLSLAALRRNIAREIGETNGLLSFEDANEWQNGGD